MDHQHDGDEQSRSASASTSTLPKRVRAEERAYKSEMMFIGQRCHWHACHREDFLPFRCADCHESFCSEHFRTQQHACPHPTPSFVVPLCPLCHEPPTQWKRDEDPNVAMDAHLSPDKQTGRVECSAIGRDGLRKSTAQRRAPKRENECDERRCRKLMVVPIQCPSCSRHFCPSHRAPVQHECSSVTATTTTISTSTATKSKPSPGTKLLDALASKRAASTAANVNAQHNASVTADAAPTNSSSTKDKLNPVKALNNAASHRKMDKRAKAEHLSAIKAMQARHKKGLLTPAEQVKLAEEMAVLHNQQPLDDKAAAAAEKRSDCIII